MSISFRPLEETEHQLEQLTAALKLNKSQVIIRAIAKLHERTVSLRKN